MSENQGKNSTALSVLNIFRLILIHLDLFLIVNFTLRLDFTSQQIGPHLKPTKKVEENSFVKIRDHCDTHEHNNNNKHTHAKTTTHLNRHTHTLAHTHTHILFLFLFLFHTSTNTYTHKLSLSLSHKHTLSLTHTRTRTYEC